jgi:hypothetical protein
VKLIPKTGPSLTTTFREQSSVEANAIQTAPLLMIGRTPAKAAKVPLALSTVDSTPGKKKRSISPTNPIESPAKYTIDTEGLDLPVLPRIHRHLMDRTAIAVRNLSAETLLKRTFDFLRLNSISFYLKQEEGRVNCTTPMMLSFVIRLWRQKETSSTTTVVMEVQRCQGCSVEMNSLRRSICAEIQSGERQTVYSSFCNK